jgi:DNA-binding NarL/FixJ family response regulator
MKEKITVVVFDDNPKVLESLEVLISLYPDLILAGTYADDSFLEDRIKTCKPQVVIMDIDMPAKGGIEATRVIKQKFPEVQILMQTAFDDDYKIFESLCAGASGYILKGNLSENLADAIYNVYYGGSPMSPTIARKVIFMLKNYAPKEPATDKQYQFTQRELEVLSLLVEGLSYKQIADKLSITYSTVHTHIKSVYKKLHVASMTEAVTKAIRERLV